VAAYALFAGIAVLGLIGVAEYSTASIDAGNWRIFADWHNPNALAGMLIIGVFVGFGLFPGATERLEKLLLGFGLAAVLAALWFTASKGGLLAAGIGIVAWVLLNLFKRGAAGWWKGAAAGAVGGLLLVGLLAVGASLRGTSDIGGRLAAGGAEEQSVGFRSVLWKDTFKIASEMPLMGHGSGTYNLVIHRDGTTLGSALAHQTYLQTAAEIGFVGVGLAVAIVILWVVTVLRKHPSEPPERAALRYAIVAGVLAVGANGFTESNLSFFGIRIGLFALLGIGLNLSVDGLVPERIPPLMRGVVASLLALGAGYTFAASTYADAQVANALSALQDSRPGEAQRALLSAQKAAPTDPEPTYQLARLALAMDDAENGLHLAQRAVAKLPSATHHAILAEAYIKNDDLAKAVASMDSAILADPNDPYWRAQKFEMLRSQGLYEEAEKAAEDAIAAEDWLETVPNALAWHVPTDTLTARRWLLQRAGNTADRMAILKGLFERLALFAERSAPELSRVTGYINIAEAKTRLGEDARDEQLAEEMNATLEEFRAFREAAENTPLVGETVALAKQKQELLFEVGEELERLYRSEGDDAAADAVRARLDGIEDAGFLR
jgi:O-antigen ligase